MAGELIIPTVAAPANPAASKGLIYATTASPSRLVHIEATPASHTLLTADSTDTGAGRLKNKDLEDATTNIVDDGDTTKKLAFSVGGNTTGIVATIATAQTTAQTLNVPNIAGSSIIITDTLAQNVTGVKTMTNMTTAAGTTAVPSATLTAGTNMTNPTAGAVEFDGTALYSTNDTTNGRRYNDTWNYFRLSANGSGITTIADFFGTNDGIPTVLNGVYEIEWYCYLTTSGTAATATWTIVNTQTVTNMVAEWTGNVITGLAATGAVSMAGVITQTAASVALPVTGTLSNASHLYVVHAVIEAGTAGNVRLRLTMGASGTGTPLRDSYFKVRRLSAGNAGTYVA